MDIRALKSSTVSALDALRLGFGGTNGHPCSQIVDGEAGFSKAQVIHGSEGETLPVDGKLGLKGLPLGFGHRLGRR